MPSYIRAAQSRIHCAGPRSLPVRTSVDELRPGSIIAAAVVPRFPLRHHHSPPSAVVSLQQSRLHLEDCLNHLRSSRRPRQYLSYTSSCNYAGDRLSPSRTTFRSVHSSSPFRNTRRAQQARDNLEHQNFPHKPQSSAPRPQRSVAVSVQAGIGNWSTILLVALSATSYVVFSHFVTSSNTQDHSEPSQDSATEAELGHILEFVGEAKMTGEALPGRPGTLTSDQEEKLRQFWIATLQVFGVLEGKPAAAQNPDATDIPDKKKKKRLGLFSRKDKDGAEDAANEDQAEDDKFGQTKQFHDTLASQSPESLRATFWSMVKHDHPDALLLRFLRARKWDVEKALVMMVSTMHWRAHEMHVDDDIVKNGEEGALRASQAGDKHATDFLTQMRIGKSFLHGTDAEGRPMCFVRVKLHKQGEQSEESLQRYTVFVIEQARMMLSPPVDTACVVFDMTGFSLANMDYSPVKFMIKCFEANYPESLGVVLVHKAPWVFQGIWKIIRGWLDPVVASKVQFTSNESDMEAFVPRSHIPKDMGGTEDWTYSYTEPVLGENKAMDDIATREKLLAGREEIVKKYEKATLDWIERPQSQDLSEIKMKRHTLAMDLRDDYWKLDPYIRAKSSYDRVGTIQSGGKLHFYPAEATTNGAQTDTSADDID